MSLPSEYDDLDDDRPESKMPVPSIQVAQTDKAEIIGFTIAFRAAASMIIVTMTA